MGYRFSVDYLYLSVGVFTMWNPSGCLFSSKEHANSSQISNKVVVFIVHQQTTLFLGYIPWKSVDQPPRFCTLNLRGVRGLSMLTGTFETVVDSLNLPCSPIQISWKFYGVDQNSKKGMNHRGRNQMSLTLPGEISVISYDWLVCGRRPPGRCDSVVMLSVSWTKLFD